MISGFYQEEYTKKYSVIISCPILNTVPDIITTLD